MHFYAWIGPNLFGAAHQFTHPDFTIRISSLSVWANWGIWCCFRWTFFEPLPASYSTSESAVQLAAWWAFRCLRTMFCGASGIDPYPRTPCLLMIQQSSAVLGRPMLPHSTFLASALFELEMAEDFAFLKFLILPTFPNFWFWPRKTTSWDWSPQFLRWWCRGWTRYTAPGYWDVHAL